MILQALACTPSPAFHLLNSFLTFSDFSSPFSNMPICLCQNTFVIGNCKFKASILLIYLLFCFFLPSLLQRSAVDTLISLSHFHLELPCKRDVGPLGPYFFFLMRWCQPCINVNPLAATTFHWNMKHLLLSFREMLISDQYQWGTCLG